MTCPLCQYQFERSQAGCSHCPMAGACHVICCPNCHYQFVEHSAIVDFFRRLAGRWLHRRGSPS